MKPAAVSISLLLLAQLCAHADPGGCKSQESRVECPQTTKDSKQPEESQGQQQAPTARRRAVPAMIEPARPAAPPTASGPPPQAPTQAPPVGPTMPSPTSSCDAGGCWGNNANRYNDAGAGTYLDNSGRPCHRVGSWMQCF